MTQTFKQNMLRRAAMLLLVMTLGNAGAMAQDAKGIVVWLHNGDKTNVLFTDMPEFSYADGYLTLQTTSSPTTLSWPLEDVEKLTFEDITTGIGSIEGNGLDIFSDKMEVYDLNGRLIKKGIKSLSELPKGVYIVKDGSVTIKVVRK